MADPGRPTDLTKELELEIRKLVLEGKKSIEIQQELDIPKGTWDYWVWNDSQGFRTKRNEWKRERMLRGAEAFSNELMRTPHKNDEGKVIDGVLRVKQKEAEFIRSTIGKDEGYTTRGEVTGKNGDALNPPAVLVKFIDGENNRDSEGVPEAL